MNVHVVKFLLQGYRIDTWISCIMNSTYLKPYDFSRGKAPSAKMQGACAPFAPLVPTPLIDNIFWRINRGRFIPKMNNKQI